MAEVLASLKKIGGSGEQYTETVLWTNPSPTSSFATQNVTLSDAITNYKYIGFKWKAGTSSATYSTMLTLVTDFMRATGADQQNDCVIACKWTNDYIRRIEYLSPTSIAITGSYRLNATGNNNGVNIPLEILGINELAHQTVVGKYAVTDIQKITANTVPTFATRGKALAIWFTFGSRNSGLMQALTNVNPSTGEINNNEVYYAYYNGTSQLAQWVVSTHTFVVTDNSISTSAAVSSGERWGYIGYTYE